MKILGIETSMDETAVAVVEDGKDVLAFSMATSLPLHAQTGGVIPEVAAREQVKDMIPTIDEALRQLEEKTGSREFDAVAVTEGPGMIGSLLIGVETSKVFSWLLSKPLVPVHHLIGHTYANYLDVASNPPFPFITLIVSGGHTELVLFEDYGKWKWLGGTRDDAAGEAFDKVARILGLPFPGGPKIQKLAPQGDPTKYQVPRPMLHSGDYDFSFSGIKTAMHTLVDNLHISHSPRHSGLIGIFPSSPAEVKEDSGRSQNDGAGNVIADLAASFQEAVVDVLVTKTVKAATEYHAKAILLSGGVAANLRLRERLENNCQVPVYVPKVKYCTDNGAMIASAAYFVYQPRDWQKVQATPGLSL